MSLFSNRNVKIHVFDSGANCCVTNQREDFVGEYKRTSGNQTVDGIGKCLKIEGTGHVAWTFVADNGQYRTLKLPCSCVPTMNGRIASMQEILSTCPNERFTMDGNNLVLSGYGAVPGITVPYDKNNQFLRWWKLCTTYPRSAPSLIDACL